MAKWARECGGNGHGDRVRGPREPEDDTKEGGAPIHVLDWPMALIASSDPSTTAYTSVELTPYNSGESPAQQHPSAELWYDSMIVSTARIGDSERQG